MKSRKLHIKHYLMCIVLVAITSHLAFPHHHHFDFVSEHLSENHCHNTEETENDTENERHCHTLNSVLFNKIPTSLKLNSSKAESGIHDCLSCAVIVELQALGIRQIRVINLVYIWVYNQEKDIHFLRAPPACNEPFFA